MAESWKIIHMCDHNIESYNKEVKTVKLKRDKDIMSDLIVPDASIQKVYSVYKNKGALRVKYLLGEDYEVGSNRIHWLKDKVPPGEEYYAECYIVKPVVESFEAEYCPRCMSNGWYVDLLPQSELECETITSSNKIVQEFLKGLFTRIRADGYGSKIDDYISENVYDPVQTTAELTTLIYQVGEKYKKSQSYALAEGVEYREDEILESVQINNVEYVKDLYTLLISITLVSRSGQERYLGIEI